MGARCAGSALGCCAPAGACALRSSPPTYWAHALIILGEYGRHLALLGEAEALARALDDRAQLGRVLVWMATSLRITGDPDGAMTAGQQALEIAVELGDSALQVEAASAPQAG